MPRINLLPWREEKRKERQQEFFVSLGISAAFGATVVFGALMHVDRLIDHQNTRNNFLRNEIAAVDEKIKEINELRETKQRLLARMQIIERLQTSRPEVVHLFDELVR
ncbi:MAG: pilus assembly protein PilN, partial [Gammaproteobacteria bacterium]|nr:pilus assembly protein PilN [Gammaproteobacteria bacterium]